MGSTALFEPILQHVKERGGSWLDPERGDERTETLAVMLCEALERLEPISEENSYREVWIVVPRGSPDDWATFEDYKTWYRDDEGSEPTKEQWLEEWSSWFPKSEYWHLLGCREDDGWITIGLDNRIILQTSPEEKSAWRNEPLEEALCGLTEKAAEAIASIEEGSYGQQIEKNLPLERRYGLVKRAELWKIDDWYRMGFTGLTKQDADRLAKKLVSQGEREDIGRIPSLTTGRYFSLLKEGYQICGYENDRESLRHRYPVDDGRSWYDRFGDSRDDTLLEVDPDDPEAFTEWYASKAWGLDHNFEIFQGRGCHRVHLNPYFDEAGWYLSQAGSITWHGADMARIWEHMNDAGIPTFQCEALELASALKGEDYVLVMPSHVSTDYARGEYFGRHIVTAIHLPEENRDAIASIIEWQPIEMPKLRD